MKSLVLILSILMSQSLIAGDLVLVCEDQYGEPLASKSVNSKTTVTALEYHDMASDKYTINVSYLHEEKAITYIISEMNSGIPIETDYQKVEFFQEASLPFGHKCMVRD